MNKFKLGLTLVFAAAITSCEKTEQADTPNSAGRGSSHLQLKDGKDNWQEAQNPDNPYDNIGLEHNRCLSYIVGNVPIEGLTDAGRVYEASLAYAGSRFERSQLDGLGSIFSIDDLASVYATFNSGVPDQEYLLNVSGLEGGARDYLSRLLSQVYTQEAATLSCDELKRIVVEWEAGIPAERLNEQDTRALYAFGSTLRYSMRAWAGVEFPSDGGGHVELRRLHLFGWIVTIVSDAIGAVGGAATGTVAGAVVVGAAFSGGAAAVASHNDW